MVWGLDADFPQFEFMRGAQNKTNRIFQICGFQLTKIRRFQIEDFHMPIGKIDPVFYGKASAQMDVQRNASRVRFTVVTE